MVFTSWGQSVGAIVLADGWTESDNPQKVADETSALIGADHEWISYVPIDQQGTVETTDVYPAFFGFDPLDNPGRAGLELRLAHSLGNAAAFCSVRVEQPSRFMRLAQSFDVATTVSKFSSDGRTILLTASDIAAIEALLQSPLLTMSVRVSHLRQPRAGWLTRRPTRKSNLELIGWAHGALFSALQLCGIESTDSGAVRRLSPCEDQSQRLSSLLSYSVRASSTPLIYLKDSAWYARNEPSKRPATEFVATVIAHLLKVIQPGDVVLCISDHNSDPNVDETLAEPTGIAAFFPVSHHAISWPTQSLPIPQRDLITLLASHNW